MFENIGILLKQNHNIYKSDTRKLNNKHDNLMNKFFYENNDFDQNKLPDFKSVIIISNDINEIWPLAAFYLVKNNFCLDEKSSKELRFMI